MVRDAGLPSSAHAADAREMDLEAAADSPIWGEGQPSQQTRLLPDAREGPEAGAAVPLGTTAAPRLGPPRAGGADPGPAAGRHLFNFVWAGSRQIKLVRTGRRLLNLVRIGQHRPVAVYFEVTFGHKFGG